MVAPVVTSARDCSPRRWTCEHLRVDAGCFGGSAGPGGGPV